ncbi:MAG: crotonase/enoyl-CoA hydratase family protein [Acidimicrobiales bacterium]
MTDDGPIRVITIDRPHRRNAIDRPTADALEGVILAFEEDDAALVAVLTGAGDTFCAGADLKAPAEGNANRFEPTGAAPLGPTRLFLSKPVIAAIEGFAVAGGLELAIWCDLRVASSNARLGVACRRWGLPLADGGTVRLPRLIGQGRALDLILTGRDVDGNEAHRMGLVDRVAAPGTALITALELARQIAEHPQYCLRNDRRSTYEQWTLTTDDALANEFRWANDSLRGGDPADGLSRFAESPRP